MTAVSAAKKQTSGSRWRKIQEENRSSMARFKV
jgi:hypothetical protein